MARRWQPIKAPVFQGDVVSFCQAMSNFAGALQQQLDTRSREADAPTKNAYTVENGVLNLTLDVGGSTLAETQQFLGTLVNDLKMKGVLR